MMHLRDHAAHGRVVRQFGDAVELVQLEADQRLALAGLAADRRADLLNPQGRIIKVGETSIYDGAQPVGPRNLFQFVLKRADLLGRSIFDYLAQPTKMQAVYARLGKWFAEGKIKVHETVYEGIENAPQAQIDLLASKNIGKMLMPRLEGEGGNEVQCRTGITSQEPEYLSRSTSFCSRRADCHAEAWRTVGGASACHRDAATAKNFFAKRRMRAGRCALL